MATTAQQQTMSSAMWLVSNPVLAAGEIGLESDTGKFKLGNGLGNWVSLKYFLDKVDSTGPQQERLDGSELRVAKRQSQYSWTGGDWLEVEGLQFRLSTTDGPAYLHLNLGLIVVNGVGDVSVGYRILDTNLQRVISYNTINLAGRAEGFNSTLLSPISGRIGNGVNDHRFVAQVQVTGSYVSAYIIPDWLTGASGDLYAIGA